MFGRIRNSRAARGSAAAVLVALVSAAAASAAGDTYKLSMNATDQASARSVLLKKTDLGNPADWTGGPAKPDVVFDLSCPDYHPKLSSLVMTGAAAATYRQPGVQMRSEAQVFQSAKMVQLDWKRTASSPAFLACMRASTKNATDKQTRFVSLRELAVPRIGASSVGFRMLLEVSTDHGKVPMVVDVVGFIRGRTEVSITTTMPATSVPSLFPNEIVLAKVLASRTPA